MSYQPHNFQSGDVLLASQLNEMDNQIAENLSADQGVANAGKILVVGVDGIVVPMSLQSASGVSF